MTEVSIEEMVEFIYDRCADDLTEEQIEMVLELQQEFLDSKGLIELEEAIKFIYLNFICTKKDVAKYIFTTPFIYSNSILSEISF